MNRLRLQYQTQVYQRYIQGVLRRKYRLFSEQRVPKIFGHEIILVFVYTDGQNAICKAI